MREILIKNSKLKLTKLNFNPGDLDVYLDSSIKKNMKYQELYEIKRGVTNLVTCRKVYGQVGKIDISFSGLDVSEIWVLEKTNTKNSDYEYDALDSEIVRLVASYLSSSHVPVAEVFIQALGDLKLQRLFYEAYGEERLSKLTFALLNYETVKDKLEEPRIDHYSPIYQSTRRYSVYDLIDDLVKDKAEVLTDADLIGKYLRISVGVETGAKFIHEKWSKVTGKLGNKRRANMSLTFVGKVKVEIPENEFDIEPGSREFPAFRSLCIIRDGSLWMPRIGVKLKSRDLIGKLKGIGVITGTLLFDGEYTLDLTKLPIVNRHYTRGVNPGSIFYPEIENRLSRIAITYLDRKIWMAKEKLDKYPEKRDEIVKKETDKKKEFLRSLGIYDDDFYPPKYESKTVSSYEATEVERKIVGLPDEYGQHITNHINKGKCKNTMIETWLTRLDELISGGRSLSDLKEFYTIQEKNTKARIVDTNFRLILNKKMEISRTSRADEGKLYPLVYMGESVKGRFKISTKQIPI